MSERITVKKISDITMAFITDATTDIRKEYETFGVSYKLIKRGLADFPYTLEISMNGKSNGAIILYRGTTPGKQDKRALFKVVLIRKNNLLDPNDKSLVAFRRLAELARKRNRNEIAVTDNTNLLNKKLHDFKQNSR